MSALTPAIAVRAGDIIAGEFAPVPVRKVNVQTNWSAIPFDGFEFCDFVRTYTVTGVDLSLGDGTVAHCHPDALVPVMLSNCHLSEPSLN